MTANNRQAALSHSRRKFDPVAMLFVVHGETPASLRLSTDGDPAAAQNIYKSTINGRALLVEIRRDGDFMLAQLPGWMVIKFGLTQSNNPGLSAAVAWTDEQRAAWRQLRAELIRARHLLEEQRRRRHRLPRPRSPAPFGLYA